jgi:hypothetical protein
MEKKKLVRLRLDVFGGILNVRKMRGGLFLEYIAGERL